MTKEDIATQMHRANCSWWKMRLKLKTAADSQSSQSLNLCRTIYVYVDGGRCNDCSAVARLSVVPGVIS